MAYPVPPPPPKNQPLTPNAGNQPPQTRGNQQTSHQLPAQRPTQQTFHEPPQTGVQTENRRQKPIKPMSPPQPIFSGRSPGVHLPNFSSPVIVIGSIAVIVSATLVAVIISSLRRPSTQLQTSGVTAPAADFTIVPTSASSPPSGDQPDFCQIAASIPVVAGAAQTKQEDFIERCSLEYHYPVNLSPSDAHDQLIASFISVGWTQDDEYYRDITNPDSGKTCDSSPGNPGTYCCYIYEDYKDKLQKCLVGNQGVTALIFLTRGYNDCWNQAKIDQEANHYTIQYYGDGFACDLARP